MSSKKLLALLSLRASQIPRTNFIEKASHSSGPGGQNVNNRYSKITIRFPGELLPEADWYPPPDAIRNGMKRPYMLNNGDLSISSDTYRSQSQNREDCFEKLAASIRSCVQIAPEPKEPTLADKQRQYNAECRYRQISKLQKAKKESRRQKYKQNFEF